MNWILIGSGILLVVALALLIAVRFAERRPVQRPKKPRAAVKPGKLASKPLTRSERAEMLENVRSAAKRDPKKTAALLREWIESDPPGKAE